MANKKRINPNAPYFVQMREQERRLILSTIAVARQTLPEKAKFTDQLRMAADLLGVEMAYLRVRGRVLGGVLEGDPKHEPPTITTTQAWNRNPNKSPKLTIVKPEPEEFDESDEATGPESVA